MWVKYLPKRVPVLMNVKCDISLSDCVNWAELGEHPPELFSIRITEVNEGRKQKFKLFNNVTLELFLS